MECRRLYFVSVLILCGIVSARHVHHAQREKYLQHLRRVDRYHQRGSSCSAPKEAIVHLDEIIFDTNLMSNEKISPTATVLHRCESCIGCDMQPGYSCAARSSEQVNLTFYVTTINGSHKHYKVGQAMNHTSCWCQPSSVEPKK